MTWHEFKEAHHLRMADRCCLNCEHGREDYDGESYCHHPAIEEGRYSRSNWSDVCDMWEKKKEEGGAE